MSCPPVAPLVKCLAAAPLWVKLRKITKWAFTCTNVQSVKVVKTIIFKAWVSDTLTGPNPLSLFAVQNFQGVSLFGKFVNKKMKGALWPHQYFTPCPPWKMSFPRFAPWWEKAGYATEGKKRRKAGKKRRKERKRERKDEGKKALPKKYQVNKMNQNYHAQWSLQMCQIWWVFDDFEG